MRKILRFCFVFLILLIEAIPAFAHHYKQGDIEIGHVWAPQTSDKAKMGAIYIPFFNEGEEEDTLTSAETPDAEKVEFHKTEMKDGVASMKEMPDVPLPPGKKVEFRPGKMHFMLVNLKKPLKDGDHIMLTLHFAKAGDIEVDVHVQKTASTNDELEHEHHHH